MCVYSRYFSIIFFVLSGFIGLAQYDALAENYESRGEYEKALSRYQTLYKNQPFHLGFFLGIVHAYQQLEKYDEAIAELEKKITSAPNLPQLIIELGRTYELKKDEEKAKYYYSQVVEKVREEPNYAYSTGPIFRNYSLLDEAARVYETAMEIEPRLNFNRELAVIYGEQGNLEKMFDNYISIIGALPSLRFQATTDFRDFITDDPLNEANIVFRKLLLKKLQAEPDIIYNRLLSWLFIQQKELKKSFSQEKAIFKRTDDGMASMFDLSQIAIEQKDTETAQEILDYILSKSIGLDLRIKANRILLSIRVEAAEPRNYNTIRKEYETLLSEFGRGAETVEIQKDYAYFLAFKTDEKQEAVTLLKKVLRKRLNRFQEAGVKILMGDILMLDEKFNTALIYYTQVQTSLKNHELAQTARFKVAQASYYKGDFDWAQTQLKVLKESTSQLIANDAMELSLVISDNSLEDSTQAALKIFAKADLLAFQGKEQEAIDTYQELLDQYKGEKIEDETLLRQALLLEKDKKFEEARTNYLKILEFFKEDILADDAYYYLGNLYADHLDNPQRARENYERIIFDHPDSIYYVEAQKKFRRLRGDAIN